MRTTLHQVHHVVLTLTTSRHFSLILCIYSGTLFRLIMDDEEIPILIDANEDNNLNSSTVKVDQSIKKVPITIVTGMGNIYVLTHRP